MSRLKQQVLAYLPPTVKAFIDGSSRRDLLRKVNTTLLVFDDQVAHVESGRICESESHNGQINYEHLAQSCQSLLAQVHDHASKDRSILLLLPPSLFVATHIHLPGINSDNIVSALELQTETLLPANDNAVALAINPKVAELSDEPTAIWCRRSTLESAFTAFAEVGLFVAAVKPRVLNLTLSSGAYLDSDKSTITRVDCQHNAVTRWLQTNRADLEHDAFAQQWREATGNDDSADIEELSDIDTYLALVSNESNQDYSFFPQGALSARQQVEKGRNLLVAAAVLVTALFLSSIPFLIQSIQFRSLAATLETQRELSYDARQDQAVVVNFENEFGPISDFPAQQVRQAMFTLQSALAPNQLSSLEITKGQISIQGTSAEPQTILQRLEQDPMFTEVAFSRATNNDRYYIGLRLSTVNFDSYMVRYFPDN